MDLEGEDTAPPGHAGLRDPHRKLGKKSGGIRVWSNSV